MKTSTLFFIMLIGSFLFLLSPASAQVNQQVTAQDSLKQEILAAKTRIDNLETLRKTTSADAKAAKRAAKEADRINDDAAHAAKEAKHAARLEAKAQKNRIKADKIARKAERAKAKSDSN